ncbi:MAG TPA: vitamin K epoxide reductase family protein, partial [Thermoanaerobaculaceae bacterium]|nr:vitamin K epoxide reductase family protein [Thermoanaerobaculaceae bacterium]
LPVLTKITPGVGLVWFAVALALARASLRVEGAGEPPRLRAASLWWTGAGVVAVLWLVYQELGVIGKVCVWCTAVHLVVLALLVLQVLSAPRRTGRSADPQ